jgi:hypothetical protein
MPLQFVTGQIKDLAISTAKIADDAITSAKIADLNIITALLADDAVSQAKIADGAVGADQLASSAVVFASLAGGLVDTDLSSVSSSDDTLASAKAIKSYVDSVASGLDVKESCKIATTANITLSGTQTIDGVAIAADQRVLVKDQSTATQNGIYLCKAGAWARSSDFAAGSSEAGAFTFVEEGTVNADNGFVCTNNAGSDVVGTADIAFSQFSGAGSILAGDGLAKSGNTLSVNVDGSSLEIVGDALQVATGGVTNAMLAGSIADSKLSTIASSNKVSGSAVQLAGAGGLEDSTGLKISDLGVTNAMLAGSIANAKLSNSSVSFGGVSLSLGGSDTTPAFDLTDATNYPTSSLSGTITNTQLAGSIALTKLDTIGDGKVIVGNSGGVATAVALSGDATISNAGALAIGASKIVPAMVATTVAGNGIAGGAGAALSVDINTGEPLSANISSSGKLGIVLNANGGLEKASSQLQIKLDGTKLQTTASGLTIKTGGVDTDAIAASAVTGAKIADNAVTLAKMAGITRGNLIVGDTSGDPSLLAAGSPSTVLSTDGTDIAYAQVDNAMIANDAAIALSKLAEVVSGNIIVGSAAAEAASVTMSGDAVMSNTGALTISNGAVSSTKIADDAISLDKLGITPAVDVNTSTLNDISTVNLSQRIADASYRNGSWIKVFFNGQRLTPVADSEATNDYSDYYIDDNGTATSVNFGGSLPNGSVLVIDFCH